MRTVAACLVLLCLVSHHAAATPARVLLHDAEVVADEELARGAEASVHVATFAAADFARHAPLPKARVVVALVRRTEPSTTTHARARARTGPDGTTAVRFTVPRELEPGAYELVVHTRSRYGASKISQDVAVVDATKLHLRTDRGVYRPGQSLRWRVIAINNANGHPVADRAVEVAVHDPRGTAIWRGRVTTDAAGMIRGQVPLGKELVLGAYKLTASSDEGAAKTEASTHVMVRHYRLPAFTVGFELAQSKPYRPGSTLQGHLVARYVHGEPVAGQVTLLAKHDRGSTRLDTPPLDSHGRAAFSLAIPEDTRELYLTAQVTDGAGRSKKAFFDIPLRASELAVALIPERPAFAPGVRQYVTVLTTDGQGSFVPAELRLHDGHGNQHLHTAGAVRVPVTPRHSQGRLTVRVRATSTSGESASHHLSIPVTADRGRWLRPRRAVVRGGEAIELTGRWERATPGDASAASRSPLAVTLLRRGAPVATAAATVDDSGRLRARITPPPGVFGLVTVRVADARWAEPSGDVRAEVEQTSVFIRPTELDVTISAARRHAPGATARLRIQVRDRAGRPVPDAGLAASVVDERALLLEQYPRAPDLVRALLEGETHDAESMGLAFAGLLANVGQPPADRERVALRALIESLPPPPEVTPQVHMTAARRWRAEVARMYKVRRAVIDALLTDVRPPGKRLADGRWEFAQPLGRILARSGAPRALRFTPWRRPMDWAYARRLRPGFTFNSVARDITAARLRRLSAKVESRAAALARPDALARMARRGQVARYLIVDPWGTAFRLTREPTSAQGDGGAQVYVATAAGPDRVFDTRDDIVYHDLARQTSEHGLIGYGYGTGSGYGGMRGRAGAVPQVRIGAAGGTDEVAVRKRFDQTVLWAAGLRTDDRGQVDVDVALADSVTGWRVEVEALSPQGAMGVGRARLETTLPLYLDVDMPRALTVGDRYDLPVVVANHSREAKSLRVDAALAGSVAPARAAAAGAHAIRLPPGTTGLVTVSMEARAVGAGTIDLVLRDTANQRAVDAVQHTLEVRAQGNQVRAVHVAGAGHADGAAIRFAFTAPARRAPGTTRGTLRLYRSAVDQALDGLEGMLREPHGCFEQTSSATYPNLLVLSLLGSKGRHALLRKRARDLVATGYQRLISYEVPGGGFSWFGERPANRVLTAYGLMEFTDMAAVYPVDPALIERTRAWLLDQQQPSGAWAKDDRWLHQWSAVQGEVTTTAYITWALAEAGRRDDGRDNARDPALDKALEKAFGYLAAHRDVLAADPYLLALWAAAESAAGPGRGQGRGQALRLLLSGAERAERTERRGRGLRFPATQRTLFYADGQAADIQVTALAALALARSHAHENKRRARQALRWLWHARSPDYGWGTTQGTVLALRAAAALTSPAPVTGTVRVRLDGRDIGAVRLDAAGVPSLDLPADRLASLAPGRHELVLQGAGAPARWPMKQWLRQGALRADLRLRWRTGRAPAAEQRGLAVTLEASQHPVRVGQRVDLRARLENPGKEAVAMPTVVIPVPPGLRPDRASLEALERVRGVDKVEDLGAEIHIYMTRLDPGAAVDLPYRLEAVAACDVMQPSVQAYAYYDPRTRGSSAALRLRALPRAK